jgi:hypothetical protein
VKRLSWILLAILFAACGADTVNVTLLTPIPVANPTKNLAETMLVQGGTSNAIVTAINGPSCKQRDLRAGFRAPNWNTPWIPIALDTELFDFDTTELTNLTNDPSTRPTGGPTPIPVPASVFLNQKSALRRPIVIPVPKGVVGELSVQGVLVEPIGTHGTTVINEDGTPCKRLDLSMKPLKSFAVYGFKPFKTNISGNTTLDINLVQSIKPASHGSTPGTYLLPTLSPLNDTTSDFKCRIPNDPRSCGNNNLLRLKIDFSVSPQFLIQHPPPPSNETLTMFMGLPYTPTGQSNTYYLPKMSPLLLTYASGSAEANVLVQFFQKQITYLVNGVRVNQPLLDCATQGSPGKGLVGNLPTDINPAPTPAVSCGTSDFSFSIADQGNGFN